MASIYLYNRNRGKCLELNTPQINEDDIVRLRSSLPTNLEGIYFNWPFRSEEEETQSEFRVENREQRVAEYLKNIGHKLEELQQLPGAFRFYDLSHRLSGNSEMIMMKARVLSQNGHVEKAERLLRQYIENEPDSPHAYYMFGKLALSRTDYEQAKKYFSQAKEHIRLNNVEHKQLAETLSVYEQFVQLYLDRDDLFNRNLKPQECIEEINQLRRRAQALIKTIRHDSKAELEGMIFFLETQDKIFEKWLQEMQRA